MFELLEKMFVLERGPNSVFPERKKPKFECWYLTNSISNVKIQILIKRQCQNLIKSTINQPIFNVFPQFYLHFGLISFLKWIKRSKRAFKVSINRSKMTKSIENVEIQYKSQSYGYIFYWLRTFLIKSEALSIGFEKFNWNKQLNQFCCNELISGYKFVSKILLESDLIMR